jgi:hypothetical protein
MLNFVPAGPNVNLGPVMFGHRSIPEAPMTVTHLIAVTVMPVLLEQQIDHNHKPANFRLGKPVGLVDSVHNLINGTFTRRPSTCLS